MSIFEDKPVEAQPQETAAAETTQTESKPTESFLSKLVEEKGENWNNPEVLAKGKLESDRYIKELEAQLEQMRGDLGKQDYAAQLLEQLKGKAPETTTDNLSASQKEYGSTDEGNTSPGLSENDLKSLVEKTLTDREKQATVQQNLATVESKMSELYGTDAAAKVQERAQELGMSVARMSELAQESPNAFFNLMGEPDVRPATMTRGSVNTESVGVKNGGERDFAYYQKLRRENRSLYYTPKMQQQMIEDKMRLGSKFGA